MVVVKKILTNLLIVGALFFIFPCMVDAETFTDGENLFVLKERKAKRKKIHHDLPISLT